MAVTVLSACLLLAFALAGAWRGTLASLLRLASLLGAYAAAFYAAVPLGKVLGGPLGLPGALGTAAGGVLAFVGAFVGLALLSRGLRRLLGRRRRRRSGLDRLGGALVGAAQGSLLVVLLGILAGLLEAGQATGALPPLPAANGSPVTRASQAVVEQALVATLDASKPSSRMAIRLVARPGPTLEGYQRLIESPRIRALQGDALFWSYVEHGALEAAMNQGSFLGITHDETTRRHLAELGLIDENSAVQPALFKEAAREVLAEVGPRIRAVRSDPAFQELANDPEVREAAASGNTARLLAHPSFRALVARALEEPAAGGDVPAAPAAQ